jgi:hypothetical protein
MTDKDTKPGRVANAICEYTEITGRVQFGPLYRCWACNAPVAHLVPFHEWVPAPTALDAVADHLAYLDLSFDCKRQGHPARVAVVGPAITPVDWPTRVAVAERLQAIQQAIALLAAALQEQQPDRSGEFDRPLALALRLYGHGLSPAQGAQEIRTLTAGRAAFAGV